MVHHFFFLWEAHDPAVFYHLCTEYAHVDAMNVFWKRGGGLLSFTPIIMT